MNLAPLIRIKETYDNGDPLIAGKLYTYQAGSSTPLATYSDAGGSLNSNPVILDSRGEADVYLAGRSYKFVLKDSEDNDIWERDDISIPQVENGFSTGDVKLCIKNVADSGWVLLNDTSIGSGSSGASGRANDDTEDLFNLLWTNVSNAFAAVSGGRGASAAADWAADKTINLPKALGRALGVYGTGSGLTARSLAETLGEQTHVLISAEMPAHTHIQDAHTHVQNPHKHTAHPAVDITAATATGAVTVNNNVTGYQDTTDTTAVNQNATAVNQSTGGDGAHNNMQPTLFLNAMIKL